MITTREATLSDIPEIKELFKETVLHVNNNDYSYEETVDWASCGESEEKWIKLITELYFIVAVHESGKIAGFSSIRDDGYLHSMFIHKDFTRQGIASLLYRKMEEYATGKHIARITSEVSITAKPFFIKQAFLIDEEQKRKANKLYLTNYKMSKALSSEQDSLALKSLANEALWQLFPIELSEPKRYWNINYITEAKRLEQTIGIQNLVRMNHIGSTAVPNLTAKPTIDILIEIAEHTDIKTLITHIESIGYIYNPQPKNPPPYMMFMKGYTAGGFKGQVFHIHVRYHGDWDEIYFRDYLIDHPEAAKEYGELKQELMIKYKHDRDAYTQSKSDFIRKITALSRKKHI